MKRRILNILTLILLISVLFILTGCTEKTNNNKSNAKEVIEQFVEAINDKDEEIVVSLIDTKTLGKMLDTKIKSKDLKSGFEDFFDGHEDFEIDIKKIYEITEENFDEELGEDLFDDYSSLDDLVEEMEEQLDVNNISIYAVKLDYPDDYNEVFDGSDNKDYLFLSKVDGEYKIFFSEYAFSFYYLEID